MNKLFNLVMPMAGLGSRFADVGYKIPKPYLDIHGKPLFYWAVKSITNELTPNRIIFVILEEHIKKYSADEIIKRHFSNAEIVALSEPTDGAVTTCIHGCINLELDMPVVFNDCDHAFRSQTLNRQLTSAINDADGILLTFQSSDPKFSYAIHDSNGIVSKTVEKIVVSNSAICGCYYFSSATLFKQSAETYSLVCPYSELFMSGLYNCLIESGVKVKAISTDKHISIGNPDEYRIAKSKPFDL